jgi:hypothetical protein
MKTVSKNVILATAIFNFITFIFLILPFELIWAWVELDSGSPCDEIYLYSVDGICDDNHDNCESWDSSTTESICCSSSGDWDLVNAMVGLSLCFNLISSIVAGLSWYGTLDIKMGQKVCAVLMLLAFVTGLVGYIAFQGSDSVDPDSWALYAVLCSSNKVTVNKTGTGSSMLVLSCILDIIFMFILVVPGCCGACSSCVQDEEENK